MKYDLIIIGSGLAGYFSFFFYKKYFPNSKVAIISSNEIRTIGVGEGGILDLPLFLFEDCGFDINDFYHNVNPVHKMGLKFKDWNKKGHEFVYSFDTTNVINNTKYERTICSNFINNNKTPIMSNGKLLSGTYSFQIDNAKFVDYMYRKSIERNAIHINSKVKSVEFENDQINKIFLNDGTELKADFYIDASGFNSIFDKFNPNKFKMYMNNFLPCNRAVVSQHTIEKREIKSFTECTTMPNGWMWEIDTHERAGKGYVFSSHFSDDEQAVKDFITTDRRLKEKDCRVIPFEAYYRIQMFGKNYAYIGNSQGFAEPLEATGFFTIIQSTYYLCEMLSSKKSNELSSEQLGFLNSTMLDIWLEIRDFVSFHYKNCQPYKNDFWNFCYNRLGIAENIEWLIDFIKEINPDRYESILENNKSTLSKNFGFTEYIFPIEAYYFFALIKDYLPYNKKEVKYNLDSYSVNFVSEWDILNSYTYNQIDFNEIYKNKINIWDVSNEILQKN